MVINYSTKNYIWDIWSSFGNKKENSVLFFNNFDALCVTEMLTVAVCAFLTLITNPEKFILMIS